MRRRRQGDEALSISFRGTVLDARWLTRVQAIVEDARDSSRQDLAREVCRVFRWQLPNGVFAVRSAGRLLAQLDKNGYIKLPPARRAQGRPKRDFIEAAAALLNSSKASLTTDESEQTGTVNELLVRPIQSDELLGWRAHMERYHYLGDVEPVGESLRYIAHADGVIVALLSWGAASLRNGPRDRYLGWNDETRRANLHLVVNNTRFLVLPWVRREHLASQVLGANLRRLSRDWEEVYGHELLLAETFVDPSRFRGTCYRASNWLSVGETKGWSKSGSTYRFNGQPKTVWLYPLRRDFKQRLSVPVGQNSGRKRFMTIDFDKLPLSGQGGLFDLLGQIADPRKRRGVRHRVQNLLATAICAVLAGARSVTAIAQWSAKQSSETLKRLGAKYGRPASERTYRRMFAYIDVEDLDRRIGSWMVKQQRLLPDAALAVDGKTSRGSGDGQDKRPLHLLSAVVHGSGVVVAQTAVDSKTNEITRVKPLFKNLDISGVVVTADALLTQRDIARHIVDDKHADYVLPVKENQPTLRSDIVQVFDAQRRAAQQLHKDSGQPPETEAFPPSARDVR